MHTQGNGRRSIVNIQSNLVCLILALAQKQEKTILQKNHRLLNKKTNAGSKINEKLVVLHKLTIL